MRIATQFVRFLAPPLPVARGQEVRRGEKVFAEIGCAACHLPALKTGPSDVVALAHRLVRAYTGLLLHDMGPELADICFGAASASEFRTEPLMGLRLSRVFLQDRRAPSIEAAIALHGGEATAARDAFNALPEHQRRAVLAFLTLPVSDARAHEERPSNPAPALRPGWCWDAPSVWFGAASTAGCKRRSA